MTLLGSGRLARTGVRDGRDVIEVSHDRIRETIVGLLPVAVVREHHGRLAAALEATPDADLEALAMHMLGSDDTERAARYAERAAEQAGSKLAFDQSARLFRLALETVDHLAKDARRLQVRLAQMLESAGRFTEAADEYERTVVPVRRSARGSVGSLLLDAQRRAPERSPAIAACA